MQDARIFFTRARTVIVFIRPTCQNTSWVMISQLIHIGVFYGDLHYLLEEGPYDREAIFGEDLERILIKYI